MAITDYQRGFEEGLVIGMTFNLNVCNTGVVTDSAQSAPITLQSEPSAESEEVTA